MATSISPAIFRNFIDGEWVESPGGKPIENRNPADTGASWSEFPRRPRTMCTRRSRPRESL